MSKLSFNCEEALINKCRKLGIEDVEEAEKLVSPEMHIFFGRKSVTKFINKSFISIGALNSKNELVGFICFHDHPEIPYLLPSEWETWLKNITNFKNARSQNTLWIQIVGYHTGYTFFFLRPIFEYIYRINPNLRHILIPASALLPIPECIKEHFDTLVCANQTPEFENKVLINFRHNYVVKYKIRRAVEEDNDSIVQLIDSHSKRLRELYGDFYISEIITGLIPCNRQLIVAEHMQRVVAVLILNDTVNYKRIHKCFELTPYDIYGKTSEGRVRMTCDLKIASSSTSSFDSKMYGSVSFTEDSSDISDISSELLQDTDIEDDESDRSSSPFGFHRIPGITAHNVAYYAKQRCSVFITAPSRTNLDSPSSHIQGETESASLSSLGLNQLLKEEEEKEEISSIGNAFALEICASEKIHECTVLPDILETAFQCFPNKDYCLFTIPSEQQHCPLFNGFVRAIPKADSVYPQELYILHRSSLKPNLSIRKMQADDYETVKKLLSDLDNADQIYYLLRQYIRNKKFNYNVHVILNYDTIIGFSAIRPAEVMKAFWEHFELEYYIDKEDYKYRNCGLIEYFHILNIYHQNMQFILRELHRVNDMPVFFYKMKCVDLSIHSRKKPLPIILNNFFPVPPRRNALYKTNTNSELLESEEPFALYIYSSRVCSFDRIIINSRLVVVGASTTGLSFISSLIYGFDNIRHLIFNNITLVHDQNINEEMTYDISKDMFIYNGHSISRLFYIYLCTNVNIVKGKMTAIDRSNKYITIDGTEILPYDLLFLTAGVQNHGTTLPRNGRDLPINVFIITQPKHASYSLKMLQSMIKKKNQPNKTHNVIVYGHTLSAYCCLGVLQRLKIPNMQIIFVHPIPEDDINYETELFNNPEIQEAVKTIIEQNDIILHKGYFLKNWTMKSKMNAIKSITIQAAHEQLKLDCIAFFHYEVETVDYETFVAVYKAGLVYDGKLVIECDCSVNDPYIFACGPMTKYSRKYYADNFTHLYYNSFEIGERLAVQVRSSLISDALNENSNKVLYRKLSAIEEKILVVPHYTQPITKSFKLPGGYTYFNTEIPGKRVPMEMAMCSPSFGRILKTGNLENISEGKDPMYFLVKLNPHGVIKQITCLTKSPLCLPHLEALWGKHESLFNNLAMRYDAGLIQDFYSYFEQPCFSAYYFEKFDSLQNKIFSKLKIFVKKIVEEERNSGDNTCSMDMDDKISLIKRKFLEHNYADIMIKEIVDFIGAHTEYLPMYAHNFITRYALYDLDD